MQSRTELVVGQFHLFQVKVEQLLAGLGDRLDQRFTGDCDQLGHVLRDGNFLAFARAVDLVFVGFHLDEVDDSAEVFFRADRQLYGDGRFAQVLLDELQGAVEVGPFARHLIDK